MWRSELVLIILIGIAAVSFFTYQAISGNKKRDAFIESEFARKVTSVEYQNKSNYISFSDGTELSFSSAMGEHYGKKFEEFIFPDDSIIKKRGRTSVLVKPKQGSPFVLAF